MASPRTAEEAGVLLPRTRGAVAGAGLEKLLRVGRSHPDLRIALADEGVERVLTRARLHVGARGGVALRKCTYTPRAAPRLVTDLLNLLPLTSA